ncbi:hypothetical protein V495_07026 [Pseudogymnoascus sp. VKM F-4514 (FW-929)]|nr:hypothetical protein V495_07026 [Pseudogymnoascus sp. VKM F-4514 (FW-929)]KFY66692.1 hypothetical protein V497_00770 [Pseudogymnoascus sp. VKM F-4516 (FW-969)]
MSRLTILRDPTWKNSASRPTKGFDPSTSAFGRIKTVKVMEMGRACTLQAASAGSISELKECTIRTTCGGSMGAVLMTIHQLELFKQYAHDSLRDHHSEPGPALIKGSSVIICEIVLPLPGAPAPESLVRLMRTVDLQVMVVLNAKDSSGSKQRPYESFEARNVIYSLSDYARVKWAEKVNDKTFPCPV